MKERKQLSTTTVQITLPDNFLKSLNKPKIKDGERLNLQIRDMENPIYRELLNNIYDAVIIADFRGKIHDFNHRSLEFFDYSKSNINLTNVKELIHGMSDSTIKELMFH